MVNVAPLIDPVTTAVVFADTSNVDSVFVAGKAVKRNGELVGHDLERAFGLLEAVARLPPHGGGDAARLGRRACR